MPNYLGLVFKLNKFKFSIQYDRNLLKIEAIISWDLQCVVIFIYFLPVNNPCGTNNGGCSHLCLIKAGGQGYSCECPDNFMIVQFGNTAHCLPMCSSTQFLCADTER